MGHPGTPLPADFAEALRGLYPSKRNGNYEPIRAVLAHARAQGWTLQAMGDVLGVCRERIRQLAPQPIWAAPAYLPIAVPPAPVPEVKPKPEPRPIPKCGTVSGLRRHQRLGERRCDACNAAGTADVRRRKASRDPANAPRHGLASTYGNWGCRCEPCKAAHSVVMRKRYEGRKR